MSGIAGIFNTDGRPANGEALDRMVEALAHRGPDGRGAWLEGPAGLGHRMFHETPESLNERQPCVDQAAQLALTADARIDNREDLIRQLDLTAEDPGLLPDSRLILLAYARWGEDCAERLIGDFAFALWDGRRRSLFCARDPFGIKPFYYGFRNSRFLFASELRGILCLEDVPRELNEEMIASYLALDFEDKEITFYQGLFRLPAAHAMRVDRQGLHLRCYWQPDPVRELHLKSDAEYAEAFREVFAEAVRCRLRSAFPVGSMLSGGMDSSSITCMARDLLAREGLGRTLKTFSAIFNRLPQVDERRYINTVIAAGGIEPTLVPMDDLGPLEKYLEGQCYEEHPYVGTNYCFHWGLHQQLQAQGVRIALDGHGGDDTVSHGSFFLTELARSLRVIRFLKECRAYGKLRDIPSSVLWRDGLRQVMPRSLLSLWRRARFKRTPQKTGVALPIAPALLKLIELRERERPIVEGVSTLRQAHARAFCSGVIGFLFEAFDKLAYGHLLVTRYPFYDRRLVEFCLSLPPDQKLGSGWGRMVLRRAMEGILPPEIQWRRDKSDVSPHFGELLLGKERQLLLQTLERVSPHIEQYVDVSMLRDRCTALLVNSASVDRHWRAVWPALTLGAWMAGLPHHAFEKRGNVEGGHEKYEGSYHQVHLLA
jgi:asparagine synthase (glutamine-hydrolysing)